MVEAGQLRVWKKQADGDTIRWSLENATRGMTISPDGTVRYQGSEDEPGGGSMFLVLEQHPDFTNDPFWRVLRPAGDTKLWSETRIEGWSEVVGEEG